MKDNRSAIPAPHGLIEPHAGLLRLPTPGQLLYRVMRAEHLIASIEGAYLHFNRVDTYPDLPGYDPHDGAQLPADHAGNASAKFERNPSFTAATYYDQSRARTYACCFALENRDHIWKQYGGGGAHGRAAFVFDFQRLRERFNTLLANGQAALFNGDVQLEQIFSVNYGVVSYVDWNTHRANEEHLPNPIEYTYLKSTQFHNEHELRIALSALGMGKYAVGGRPLEFARTLQATFDFRAAMLDGAVQKILLGPDCDAQYMLEQLARLGIDSAPGSDVAVEVAG